MDYLKQMCIVTMLFLTCTVPMQAQNAQKVTIDKRNISLLQLFDLIEQQTTLKFSYRDVTIDKKKDVSVFAQGQTIDKVLDKVLATKSLDYDIISSKSIVITKRKSLQQAKQLLVNGIVTDAQGETIIGASIRVKGNKTSGTITGLDGDFSIHTQKGNILVISFIGYKSQTITIKNSSLLKIQLLEDSEALDEVIVIGYGTQKKINLSGAVESISNKELKNRPIVNVGQALQGVIPNLNVNISDGNANSAPSFNIRGMESLSGGNPLILVDNIPVTNGEFSRINSNDIESVTVLKDAASAAVYGARAAFGVILVTTKSAKSKELQINVNAFYSTRKNTRLPHHITNPYTVMDLKNQAAYPLYNLYSDEQMALAKKVSDDPTLARTFINPDDPTTWVTMGSTDWFNKIYNTSAPSYNINANVSQRSDKGGFYLSTEYMRQDGMFKMGNDIYKRYNMRSKFDYQLTDWLNISNNTTFTSRDYDKPYTSLSSFFHNINRTNTLSVPYNPDGTYTDSGAHTIGLLKEGGREINKSQEFQTSFAATIDLIKDVWQVKADMTFRRNNEHTRESEFCRYYHNGPDKPMSSTGEKPYASTNAGFKEYDVYNVYTDYHNTFAKKHYVQGMIGFNQESSKWNSFYANRKNLISTAYPTIDLATGDKDLGESISEWSVRGVFYRLNYIYDNKYIVEFNGRYDGTSRFPHDDRFGFFPSGSLAWNVGRENFMKSINEELHMNLFKLRASYGILGNQDVSTYAYQPTMGAGKIGWILDGERPTGIGSPGLVSSALTWEKVTTKNFGIDLGFFNNRLNFSGDYYIRDTNDMLTRSATLPNVLGTSEPKENAADLETKGWETSISWRDQFNLKGSAFNYSAKFILANSTSKITKFANENRKLSDYYVGREIGEIWGLTTEGYFQTQEELDNHADQTAVGEDDQSYRFYVGDLKFKDINKDGKVDRGEWTVDDPGDFKKIGNSSNQYPYGIDLNADWNGFDLRMFFQGIGKKDWYPNGGNHYFWGIYAQPWTNVQTQNLDHWTSETPNAFFPRVKAYIAESSGSELACPQTKYLQDASYTRLKNLTFGYTLPSNLTKDWGIKNIRFYFSGENLWELTHMKGNKNLDPEALSGSIYPIQRTYSFGVNLFF